MTKVAMLTPYLDDPTVKSLVLQQGRRAPVCTS
jgi:hypothetical protein